MRISFFIVFLFSFFFFFFSFLQPTREGLSLYRVMISGKLELVRQSFQPVHSVFLRIEIFPSLGIEFACSELATRCVLISELRDYPVKASALLWNDMLYILHIYLRVCYVRLLFYKYFPLILYTLGATADCPTFISFWQCKEVVRIDSTSITDNQTTSCNISVGRFSCNGDRHSETLFLFPLTDYTHIFPAVVVKSSRGSDVSKALVPGYLSPAMVHVHFHSRID